MKNINIFYLLNYRLPYLLNNWNLGQPVAGSNASRRSSGQTYLSSNIPNIFRLQIFCRRQSGVVANSINTNARETRRCEFGKSKRNCTFTALKLVKDLWSAFTRTDILSQTWMHNHNRLWLKTRLILAQPCQQTCCCSCSCCGSCFCGLPEATEADSA